MLNEQSVQCFLDAFSEAWNRRDFKAACAAYTEDAVCISPDENRIIGREAVVADAEANPFHDGPGIVLSQELLELRILQDKDAATVASAVVSWRLIPKEACEHGHVHELSGTSLVIFTERDGELKVVYDASFVEPTGCCCA